MWDRNADELAGLLFALTTLRPHRNPPFQLLEGGAVHSCHDRSRCPAGSAQCVMKNWCSTGGKPVWYVDGEMLTIRHTIPVSGSLNGLMTVVHLSKSVLRVIHNEAPLKRSHTIKSL